MHKDSQNDAYYQAHPKGKAEIATEHLCNQFARGIHLPLLTIAPFLHQRP